MKNTVIYYLLGLLVLSPFTLQAVTLDGLGQAPGNETLLETVEQARYGVREVEGNPDHLWVQNPAQGLNARFTPQGLSMEVREAGTGRNLFTRWSAKSFGYGDNMVEVSKGKVVKDAKPGRVEIVREGLVEWYENSAKGLEHGFTLPQSPNGREAGKPLRVEMSVGGDLLCEVTSDGAHVVMRDVEGKEVLRYEKLKVWDATGRILEAKMINREGGLALEVEDEGAQYPVTIDPTFVQQAYLKPSNTNFQPYAEFGYSVAISGNTIVVGAPKERSTATGVNGIQSDYFGSDNGAVYVFVRNGNTWTQQAYLKSSNNGNVDRFGTAVSISGDTIVVGAYTEDSNASGINGDQTNNDATDAGAAYVFVRNGTTWTQQAYLKASTPGANDFFGRSVAISNNTIAVGAYGEASNATGVNGNQDNNDAYQSGAVYVFVRSGVTWTQQAYLKASNTQASDYFGYKTAIDGNTIVVGAFGEDSDATGVNGSQTNDDASGSGAVYVFFRNGSTWTQQAYLKASNAGASDQFGYSVAISGNTIAVGADLEDSNATGMNGNQASNTASASGAAYVFTRSGSTWSQQAYVKASNTDSNDRFGESVEISGNTMVVGTSRERSTATGVNGNQTINSVSASGAVYAFVRNGTAWTQQAYLKASNTGGGDNFGWSAAISGNTIVVGAYGEDSGATGVNGNQADNVYTNSGAAYVFIMLPNPPSITISSPKKKGKLPKNRKIKIAGAASQGSYPLAFYQYRLNKSGWKSGGALSGNYSTWRKKIKKAKKGRNTIQVRSFDVAGQSSPVVVRKVKLRAK